VVSAYVEHDSCAGWHFAYTQREQQAVAALISSTRSLRRAILVAWFDAVDPSLEGYHPAVELDLIIADVNGWARFATGERDEGHPVELLTVAEHGAATSPVRLGKAMYANRPFVAAERIRAAGAEYVRTGRRPESVSWQRRVGLVPEGPFGRRLVAENDLPPLLDWSYPQQAQPWTYDPPPQSM
jgi:hypothetical protein